MEQERLRAEQRTGAGTRPAKRLRREGLVPAVVYGRGIDPLSVAVSSRELYRILRSEAGANALINVEVEGSEPILTVAREVQRHPVRGEITHLDFIKVSLDVAITAEVPLEFEGEPIGLKEGGIFETLIATIEIEALPTSVPSHINVDVSGLDIGDVLTVADLPAIEGVEYLTDTDRAVATVGFPAAEVEEEEAEAVEGEEEEGEAGAATEIARPQMRTTKAEAVPESVPLIVGLRNPGARYAGTRHNVGAEVVELVADRSDAPFRKARQGIRAEVAEARIEDHRVVLALPRTFMNESGQAVAPLVRYYTVDPDRLLVVHDDIDLPFGKLRVHIGRGAGGNNGVHSTIRSLGTQEFWRLKIGVGRPPGRMDPADFVLHRFTSVERTEMDLVVAHGADVVEVFLTEGGDIARRRAGEFNAAWEEGSSRG